MNSEKIKNIYYNDYLAFFGKSPDLETTEGKGIFLQYIQARHLLNISSKLDELYLKYEKSNFNRQ